MAKRVKRLCKFCKGFTLMEVLVTVLIIGVLATICYPVYKKAITKARAAEAVNLIELVKNKQILTYASEGKYFSNFNSIERLTQGSEEKQGAEMVVNRDYTIFLNNAQSCVTTYYKKGTSAEFSFSAGYENDGLGCSGGVCNSYGNILGDTKSVCNCGDKQCSNGYELNPDTCQCNCHMGCEGGGTCYAPYGGGQSRTCASGCGTEYSSSTCAGPSWSGACSSPTQKQATSQACVEGCGTMYRDCNATCSGGSCGSWNKSQCKAPSQTLPTSQRCGRANSGTQSRACTATCGGGECNAWGPCTGQTCDENNKPVLSETCGNNGTHTRTVTCNSDTGNWNTPSAWSPCTGQTCLDSEKPALSETCGNNGTHTRTVTCNSDTGNWNTPSAWSPCTGQICLDSEKPALSETCGNNGTHTRTVTCNSDTGSWNTPSAWGPCSGQTCNENNKPVLSQNCGNCGKQTRTVTCNSDTGNWNTPSAWGSCTNEGVCTPNAIQGCGGGNGTQSCNSSCSWNTCVCGNGYHMDAGTCKPDRIECSSSNKPATSQSCGGSGTQSRNVTCDYNTGNWQTGNWSVCSCPSNTCWNGSSCAGKESTSRNCYGNVSNARSGTQSRTATCNNGAGWSYSYWSGTCTCNSGYNWNGSYCDKPLSCRWSSGKGDYVSFCDDEGGCGSDISGGTCSSPNSERSVCIQIDSRGICRVTNFTCECS